jgi:tetratricopeptide (TPR) repeat protein
MRNDRKKTQEQTQPPTSAPRAPRLPFLISRISSLKTTHVILLLAGLTMLIYANSLRNEFVFDDGALIQSNPQIRNLAQYAEVLKWDASRPITQASDRGTTHRPLRTGLLAVQFALFGLEPAGYRMVNIVFHALNGVIVFSIVRVLLGMGPAVVAALLFVVHPIQTESVAYISGQRDVLFTFFYLVGFWGFVRYRVTEQFPYLVLTALAYVMSLLTKEMAITLPVLCALYDCVRHLPGSEQGVTVPVWKAAWEGFRKVITRYPWLYAGGTTALGVVLYYFVFVANPSHQRTLYGGGLGPTLNTSARIMAHYLTQLVFPVTLNADYSNNAFPISNGLLDIRGVLAGLLVLGVGYGSICLLRINRWAALGIFWLFVTLLPVSQIVPHHELLAEHFLYLPIVGFCLVVGYGVNRGFAARRYTGAVVVAFISVIVLLGIRTVVRNRDWANQLTLWTKTVQTAPQSLRARINLAQSLKGGGRYEEALEQFRMHVTLEPRSSSGHVGMASTYHLMGRYAEATEHFRKAIELDRSSVAPIVGLAQVYASTGEHDKAAELSSRALESQFRNEASYRQLGDAFKGAGLHAQAVNAYRKGLELNPFDASLYTALGKTYTILGRHEEALKAYKDAVKRVSDSPISHTNLGAALLETGQIEEAIRAFQEALRLSPQYADAHNNLGIAYHRLGRLAAAEAEFRQAMALNPDSTEFRANLAMAQGGLAEPSLEQLEAEVRRSPSSVRAYFDLGSAYGNRGEFERAAQAFQQAMRLDPRQPRIHYAMGLLYLQRGDRTAARRAWERALQLDPSFSLARERLSEVTVRER